MSPAAELVGGGFKTKNMEQLKDNLRQSLLENLADWLSNEYVQFEIGFCGLEESEDCHIKMCHAAFEELVKDLFHPEKLKQ